MQPLAELIVFVGILAGYGLIIGPIACVIAALLTAEE
jgi:hypothetical protein